MISKAFFGFNGILGDRRRTGVDASHAALTGPGDDRSARFDAALHLIEAGLWGQAFSVLAPLADAGHPQAARIAMIFVQRGTSLFGGRFPASAQQRERWRRVGG